jgi:hypothetical protein
MKNRMNRRRFVRDTALTMIATKYLAFSGPTASATSLVVTPDAVLEVMKAAVVNVQEINAFLKKIAADVEALKKTKVKEDHFEKTQCTKVLSIIAAVVTVAVAVVIAAVTFGAGSSMVALSITTANSRIDSALIELAAWVSDIEKSKKMTPEIGAAVARFRQLTDDLKSVIVARDVFFHISQDRTLAKKLLDAVSSTNRSAIEEMLKRKVPGGSVAVKEVKEDNGIFVNVRIGNLTHCLSTSSQCSRRILRLPG